MGTRLVLNELIAYSQLGPLREHADPRTFTMATYALCGFANLGSVGIQIGGIGALIPERRNDLARARPARAAGRHPRELHHRLHRGGAAVSASAQAGRGGRASSRGRTALRPRTALVLGSGLGAFADTLKDAVRIPYKDIPHFPVSTAIGHSGSW